MLAIPLPILTFVLATVACALMWRLDLGNRLARGLFTAVFALIATGTLLIGLRFGYGIDDFIVIQRVVPLFIGPAIYLSFLALMQSPSDVKRRAIFHLGVAAIAALLPQIFVQLRSGFDFAIGVSYIYYCIALLLLWRKGADGLAFAPLGRINILHQSMIYTAGMLGLMLVFDTGIAISFAMERFDDAIWLVSLGSFFSFLCLATAIFMFSRSARNTKTPDGAAMPNEDVDIQLEQSARELLTQTELFLDTELTLERLAKRLHVPARNLSSAINQTQGINVSQYVNGFRLQYAAALLQSSGLSVISIVEQSGFLSRSNFYREFERVYSVSPVEFRKLESKTAKDSR